MNHGAYLVVPFLSVLCMGLSGCVPSSESQWDGDRGALGLGTCASGQQSECGDYSSGLLCNTLTRECERPEQGQVVQVLSESKGTGIAEGSLHPVLGERHTPAGQSPGAPAWFLPKASYIQEAAQVDASYPVGSPEWHANMLVRYRILLREEFALPLLSAEMQAITALEAQVGQAAYGGSQGFFEVLASRMADVHGRLTRLDEQLSSLTKLGRDPVSHVRVLEGCVQEFRQWDDLVAVTPQTVACSAHYLALFDNLRALNSHQVVSPAELDHLEHNALWIYQHSGVGAQQIVERIKEPVLFVHLRDLPIAMLGVYRSIVEPALRAQALYAYLRLSVPVDIEEPTGVSTVDVPLGKWAEIVVDPGQVRDAPKEARLNWFRQALQGALSVLKLNNQDNVQMLTDATITDVTALALATEHSGLMALYGGYDAEGNPQGFQRFHDMVLSQVKEQEFAAPGAAIATALACGATSITTGPGALLTAGVCLLAAGVGIYQFSQLATLATTAETLAFVGIDHSLVPASEATRLRRASNIAAAMMVVDVFFSSVDAVASFDDVIELARVRGVIGESDDAATVRSAIAAERRTFRAAYSPDLVRIEPPPLRQFEWDELNPQGIDDLEASGGSQGVNSLVYRGKDPRDGQPVFIKLLNTDEDFIAQREASIALNEIADALMRATPAEIAAIHKRTTELLDEIVSSSVWSKRTRAWLDSSEGKAFMRQAYQSVRDTTREAPAIRYHGELVRPGSYRDGLVYEWQQGVHSLKWSAGEPRLVGRCLQIAAQLEWAQQKLGIYIEIGEDLLQLTTHPTAAAKLIDLDFIVYRAAASPSPRAQYLLPRKLTLRAQALLPGR